MKAVELTGVVDEQGNLSLDEHAPLVDKGNVRVIILYAKDTEEFAQDPDDTSVEDIKASLRRALKQAASKQKIPVSEMWKDLKENLRTPSREFFPLIPIPISQNERDISAEFPA
jgi:hypothetical protein